VATTLLGAQLTVAHRAAQLAVRARSLQGLMSLWRAVDVTNLSDTIDVFAQAAALLAGQSFDQSAVAAARYFESFRTAEAVPGAARAVIATRPAGEVMIGQLRGAALKGIIDGRSAGMDISRAKTNGLVRVMGQMAKMVLAGGRMTVTNSVQRDRQALGWARVTSGDPCTFCRTLASRGPVYKSEKSAHFEAHDHDGCTVEPVYDRGGIQLGPVAQAATYKREYDTAQAWARQGGTMSQDTSNNQLNNYRRWLAAGGPEPGAPTPDGGTPNGG
jgi:hypothetical protein